MQLNEANDKLKKQVARIIFVAGFQQVVKFLKVTPQTDEERSLVDTFLIAAIQDATEMGFVGEA